MGFSDFLFFEYEIQKLRARMENPSPYSGMGRRLVRPQGRGHWNLTSPLPQLGRGEVKRPRRELGPVASDPPFVLDTPLSVGRSTNSQQVLILSFREVRPADGPYLSKPSISQPRRRCS